MAIKTVLESLLFRMSASSETALLNPNFSATRLEVVPGVYNTSHVFIYCYYLPVVVCVYSGLLNIPSMSR